MDVLCEVYNNPVYKIALSNEFIMRKKIQIIDLTKELERLINVNCISGKLVTNGYRDDHFKECSQAYLDGTDSYDCIDYCVCSKIWRLESQISVLMEELKSAGGWLDRLKRSVSCQTFH